MTAEDRMLSALWKILIAAVVLAVAAVSLATWVFAQEHRHPSQDAEIHHRFYNSWMKPSDRTASCCNQHDCYPTEARKVGGRWEAKRREDGQWLVVPPEAIEYDRDNPDGRNHICAAPPEYGAKVYCFIVGGGT